MKLFESKTILEAAKIGREYQHIEDLLIVDGAAGGIEAVEELEDSIENTQTLDFKWDGGASVYWGRNEDGQFVFVPKNQWGKGQFLTKQGLHDEIRNTGRKSRSQSDEEFDAIRTKMANQYQRLWNLFEEATPSNFRGYLNGDLMFTEQQRPNEDGTYSFTPNKITYKVQPNGLYGKMKTAEAFVIVHGKVEEFGQDASNIIMVNDGVIDQFNRNTNKVIFLNTQHPHQSLSDQDIQIIRRAKQYIASNANHIDQIANFSAPKFTTIKKVLYDFSVAKGKNHGNLDFATWLQNSKVSQNHKAILQELMQTPSWDIFWNAFDLLVDAKHEILDHLLDQSHSHMGDKLGITAEVGGKRGGEGLVKKRKSGGYTKMVNPHFRSADLNTRFK